MFRINIIETKTGSCRKKARSCGSVFCRLTKGGPRWARAMHPSRTSPACQLRIPDKDGGAKQLIWRAKYRAFLQENKTIGRIYKCYANIR